MEQAKAAGVKTANVAKSSLFGQHKGGVEEQGRQSRSGIGSSCHGASSGGTTSGGHGLSVTGTASDEPFHDEELSFIEPVYATRTAIHSAPKNELPQRTMPAYMAKALIEDMMEMDFNPRLNLSTFVNTWMEPEAVYLMQKAAAYNLADAVQYPSAAEMEKRCIRFLAKLWHCPDDNFLGTGCVGSSDACYLGGLAMKKRWQEARRSAGLPTDCPNIVISHVAQVCWQKFCAYFDVEPHYVDVTHDCLVMDPQKMREHINENSIGVVVMMGSTYNGQYEPVEEVDRVLEEIKQEKGWDIPLHVDAANAGLIAPLCQPDVAFDFRLEHVVSMNLSGHKYGLVYCGCAFIVWRSREWLPREMVFTVDYLGKEECNLTVNFSRPGAQIVAQYYNFIRLGKDGFRRIFDNLFHIYAFLECKLLDTGHFDILSTGDVPVLAFRLKPLKDAVGSDKKRTYNEYDIMMGLCEHHWMVPAYKMAPQVIEKLDKHTNAAISSPGQAYEVEQAELGREFKQRAGPC